VLPGHRRTISEYYDACLPDPSATLIEAFDWNL